MALPQRIRITILVRIGSTRTTTSWSFRIMPINHLGHWVPPATVHPSELHTPHPPGYIYQSPIPKATMQTPGELLSKYYGKTADFRDWTDPNGVLCKQQETYRYYSQYAIWPIGSPGLIAKWPCPDGLRAVPVPVYGAGSVTRVKNPEAIEFRNRNRKCPSTGVSMHDMFQRKLDALEGEGDILHGFQGEQLNFIIKWPGYDLETSTIHTRPGRGRPLTRFDLAEQITMAYAAFFKKVEDECLLPSQIGFFNIALHQGRNSKKDSLGVQLLQLYLVRFYSSVNGYWVAEVHIV